MGLGGVRVRKTDEREVSGIKAERREKYGEGEDKEWNTEAGRKQARG